MTGFDVFALLVVLVSALVGYARGGVREVVTLCAFGLAAVAAIAALPYAAPVLRHVIHPRWAAAAAAVAIVFVLAYVLVRTAGGALTAQLQRAQLGGVDRVAGGGFGVLRAVIFLGLAALMLQATPWPRGAMPEWISGGLTYPLARASGGAILALAPAGGGAAGRFGRFVKEGVSAGFQPGDVDEADGPDEKAQGVVLEPSEGAGRDRTGARRRAHERAYDRRTRDDVDQVVERSR